MPEPGDITLLLHAAAGGEPGAFDRAVSALYADLERMADRRLHGEFGPRAAAMTLDPGALVHETFLRLVRQQSDFANRKHLLAIASKIMLRVLVDYQRARLAAKRGGALRITLTDLSSVPSPAPTAAVEDLARCLEGLERFDPRKSDVVRLRFLWGYDNEEVARILDVSVATVERDWKFARAWLAAELERGS